MYKASTTDRYLERVIRLMAGLFVLISTVLGYVISPRRLLLDLLVGINLLIFALTGRCPMAILLVKLGIQPQCHDAKAGRN